MLVNKDKEKSDNEGLLKLRHFVYKLVAKRVQKSEDADDITQEVFFRGLRSLGLDSLEKNALFSYQQIEKYLTVIAHNEIRRYYKNQPTILVDISEDELHNIPADLISAETGLIILEILGDLPIKQRLIYFLQTELLLKTFINTFSLRLVAKTLELSEGSVENLATKVPFKDEQLKEVVEQIMAKELKSSVRDERWKGKKFLEKIFRRN